MPSITVSDVIDKEYEREIEFLSSLKEELRKNIFYLMVNESLTKEETAKRLGVEEESIVSALNPDRHLNTRTMFLLMYRLGRKWTLSSKPIPISEQ